MGVRDDVAIRLLVRTKKLTIWSGRFELVTRSSETGCNCADLRLDAPLYDIAKIDEWEADHDGRHFEPRSQAVSVDIPGNTVIFIGIQISTKSTYEGVYGTSKAQRHILHRMG